MNEPTIPELKIKNRSSGFNYPRIHPHRTTPASGKNHPTAAGENKRIVEKICASSPADHKIFHLVQDIPDHPTK